MTLPRFLLFCWVAAVTSWAGEDAESLRQKLVAISVGPSAAVLDLAWTHLDAADARVREVARKAIQAQPFPLWKERALEEKGTWASLEVLRALAESCPGREAATLSPHLCEQMTTLRLEQMEVEQIRAAIRLTRLILEKLGPVTEDERQQMTDLWAHLPRPGNASVAKERRELLDFLQTVRPRQP